MSAVKTKIGEGWGSEVKLVPGKFNATPIEGSEVFESTDYDFFKFHEKNRVINEEKVAFFMRVFQNNKFFLCDFPLCVDKKTMVILDAQHRFEACKRLQLPVYFRWAIDLTIDNVVDVQINAGWKPQDYLHAFIKQGKQDYVVLSRFMKRYKFSVSTAISLLRDKTNERPKSSGFYDGTFQVKNEEVAHKRAKLIVEIGSAALNLHRDRTFCHAVITITENKDYDHKRMIEQLTKYVSLMMRQMTTEAYIRNLEDIYNYKRFTENKVRFI